MIHLNTKTRKFIFKGTYILLLLFFLWQCIFKPIIDEFILEPIRTDIAKRIKSPDSTMTAILIRRNAFDLNFIVKIKKNHRSKTLHITRDFLPDLKFDWNEKIVWSDDSSLLVFTVEDVSHNSKQYIWAYDFENSREYLDKDIITKLLNSRNVAQE